jgi:hypothetical protein
VLQPRLKRETKEALVGEICHISIHKIIIGRNHLQKIADNANRKRRSHLNLKEGLPETVL